MSTIPPTETVLLRADAVAELLGWSLDAVYRRTREGRLPCLRVGRSVVYPRHRLEAWLAGATSGAPTAQ